MTLTDLLTGAYTWLVVYVDILVIACIALPLVGTGFAHLARVTRSDANGRMLAGAVVTLGIAVFAIEVVAITLARVWFDANIADAPLLLLVAPVLCLIGCLVGIHWVFPLNKFAAFHTLVDVGWFVVASAGVLWIMSKFRGWGILFGGSLFELVAIGALVYWFIRRLYRRAFKRT